MKVEIKAMVRKKREGGGEPDRKTSGNT